jgi:L-amino acid N-acyltransferase YncA
VPLPDRDLQVIVMTTEIRDARRSDVPAMLAIYNEVLTSSTAIFSDVARTEEEQARWLEERQAQNRPVLVASDGDDLVGYASYGPFRSWPGYRHTVENSIYISRAARGKGVGTQLLAALLQRAQEQRLHAVIAGIDGDNERILDA